MYNKTHTCNSCRKKMRDKIALGDKNKKKQFYNSRAPICLEDTKRIGQLEVLVIVLRRVLLFKF